MSFLRYMKRLDTTNDDLPHSRGSLSSYISSTAIERANEEVRTQKKKSNKRGTYQKYSEELRAKIALYAVRHGVPAAVRYSSRELRINITESTIRSFKSAYIEELKSQRIRHSTDKIKVSPYKKRGKPLLLGEDLDKVVQNYLEKLREFGGCVSSGIVVVAARGIVLTYDRSLLKEFGGHIELTKFWARSLIKRMKYVKRRATTTKSKMMINNVEELKMGFYNDLVSIIKMMDIPSSLVMNWDQTGVRLVPASGWTMEKRGSKRVEIAGTNNKEQITLVLCGTMTGDFLPPQVIYKGTTPRCHPKYSFPCEWNITHSPKRWSNEKNHEGIYSRNHHSLCRKY